ncbi:MAG: hypothetical protein HQ507_00630, partial [Candidatus Marinimicrobia bacterium]|nr:hypothetical protein [Candidatus Neomarinimicrobiota bacterium]
MKNMKRILAFLLITTLVSAPLFAGVSEKSNRAGMGKASSQSTGAFDGNRIDDDLENNGMIVSQRISGHSGLQWPAGNATYTIYASGIWLAGMVNDTIRTAVAEYGPEFTSGPWGADGNDPSDILYKVNKSDLLDPGANPDFAAWPVGKGAPWVDVDNDGVYNPMPAGPDHPEFIGDQVIYYVMNDGITTDHSIFSTEPLGLEVQMTIWGYDRVDAFGDMMFVRARIFNKGGNDIEDAYLGIWSDPDLGNAGDDFVGCDLDLSLGFCYNDGADNAYGYRAPAVGYDFFQAAFPTGDPADQQFCFGELKSGYSSLPMSSFVKYINGDDIYTDPNDETEAYNYMQGFKRDGSPFINSATGEPSKFVHPDDPNDNIDGTDNIWVDGDDNAADDRRFLMNVGPFDFAAGDSAEVVFGILHAQGNSALGSVSLLKFNDKYAQSAYDANFDLPEAPPIPELNVSRARGEIILGWEDNAEDYSVYVVGNNTYYNFEGYNVYQHETSIGVGAKTLVANFDLKNGVTTIKDEVFSTEYSDVLVLPIQFGTDSGLKRYVSIKTDVLNGGIPLVDDRNYYYSVTSYGYNGFAAPAVLESSSPIVSVRPQTDVNIDPNEATGAADYTVTHIGTADAYAQVTVANPYHLIGEDYEIYFDQQHYYRNLAGLWLHTAYADSVGRLAKAADITGTVVTGAAIASASVGTIDLIFSLSYASPDGAWIDGFELDLADNLTINSWGTVEGAYSSYGLGSGQNSVNSDGTMAAGNVIAWGDSARSTFGAVEGDVQVLVNVDAFTFPLATDYKVFDDGYGTIVDVAGTISITELGYEYKTIKHWNLGYEGGTALIEDQTTLNGIQHEYVDAAGAYHAGGAVGTTSIAVVDGIQVEVGGSYDAPINFASLNLSENPLGGTSLSSSSNTANIDIQNYTIFGGTITSMAIDNFGVGTRSIDELQEDLELRFTGVLDTNVVGGQTQITVASGGSMATIFNFAGGFAAHPLANGATSEFMVRVPFEVWNVDKNIQINLAFRDRTQSATSEPFYAWNMVNRMYAVVVNTPYDPDTPIPGIWDGTADPLSDLATWVLVFYGTNYNLGDVVQIAYDNPLQLGVDKYTFTTSAPLAKATDMDMVKVWPNPYFGYNPEERTPLENNIHFINLPSE